MQQTELAKTPVEVREVDNPEPTAAILTAIRQAIVDLASGSICATTLHIAQAAVATTTARKISCQQHTDIKKELAKHLEKIPYELNDLAFEINGMPTGQYEFEPQGQYFVDIRHQPLYSSGAPVALLLLSNFNANSDPKCDEILRHFDNDLVGAIGSLWQLSHKEREKYQSMVLSTLDGIILCTLEKQIKFVNGAAVQLLGLQSSERLIGKPLRALNSDYITKFLEEALKNGLHEINKVVQAPKKSQLIGVHTELLKTDRNREVAWMIVIRDVTTAWQNDQMRSALAVASHEIRTPLNSMAGALDTLLEHDLGAINEQQQRCLEILKDDVQRLNRLIDDILDLSRFEEGVKFIDRRKEISLDFLLNKVIYSFRSYAKTKNIVIQNNVPKSLPTFRGDRDRLQQVMSNLIENGIKYSLPNGTIEIEAELKNSILTFSVKDSGVGIPAESFELIFEKFKQLDNYPDHSERGYGLGLSIANEIVKAAGGKIWLESEVGVGTTFYVMIPV